LPEQVKGYVEDGESFLKCNATVFDTIIIDAFIDAKVRTISALWTSFA
jgi:hypothetical protein